MNKRLLSLTAEYFKVTIDNLNEDTTANEVDGWDSLAHASFIIFLEKELNITFDLNDMIRMERLGDLSELIDKKLN